MANEKIHKIGYGSSRTVIDSSTKEERELIINTDLDEILSEYGSSLKHWPSEERLLTGLSSLPNTDSIDSGSELIAVEASGFTYLNATNRNLQSVVADIDIALTNISAGGGLGDIKKDGSIPMEGAWSCQNHVDINNTEQVQTDYGSEWNRASDLTVLGDQLVADPRFLSYDILANGSFSNNGVNWHSTGVTHFTINSGSVDFSGTSNATSPATLLQFNSDFVEVSTVARPKKWYIFEYTVTAPTGLLTNRVKLSAFTFYSPVYIDMTEGTHKVLFKSDADADTSNFEVVVVYNSSPASFTFTNFSLREISGGDGVQGGNLDITRNLTVGNKINDSLEINKNDSNKIRMWPDISVSTVFTEGWITLKPTVATLSGGISKALQRIKIPTNHTYLLEAHIIAAHNDGSIDTYKRMCTARNISGTVSVLKEEVIYEQVGNTTGRIAVFGNINIGAYPDEIQLVVIPAYPSYYTAVVKYLSINK